ncbi:MULTISPECIES: Ppx/GppA phosphatase family protein [unclassified Corynebacterium]|uniref:Ppx/GppA phosphatase family protein n=1 Tax=unclassified Corynebacterium TaxID=2624378 RepID=UPI0029CA9145|nr:MULTISPECIES: Ppx/GppA phosphatase family protein [unclassified Corynebacterium]WPF66878.1 Ppx/GppA phosphatase family protein [Corynebacterium sp. 22KM0430]WPF69366.1 Ppx/GppA phosphatase family protein [Corynebacterium sp. 21KM1197]
MGRLAAIDCGTNSIRLLISEIVGGVPREIHRTMEIVRLGQGVDATGELHPDALERTRAALENYVDIMKFEKVERVRMVATSATRDAENREAFFSMTAELLGQIQPGAQAEVISGEEEAFLSFRGAVHDLPAAKEPFCVIDLGGGSTEFVVGTHSGEIVGSTSVQMGCVRLTERIMRSDPPTPSEIEVARDYIRERLDMVTTLVPISQAITFVGCAGTFTTLSALAQGLERYEPSMIHCSELNFDALRVLTDQLAATPSAERGMNPVIHQGRADVIGSGSIIVQEIMAMIQRETQARGFVISEKDILDGIIDSLR